MLSPDAALDSSSRQRINPLSHGSEKGGRDMHSSVFVFRPGLGALALQEEVIFVRQDRDGDLPSG